VRSIVTRIWPRIRQQKHDATLFLGGAEAPSVDQSFALARRITVESPMQDREAALRRIRVALLPIAFGSGQSLKTLEAAEGGCAIAGTALAFRGCEQLAGAARGRGRSGAARRSRAGVAGGRGCARPLASELRNRVSTFYSRQTTLSQMAHLAGVQ
jgi:hypothetical protein